MASNKEDYHYFQNLNICPFCTKNKLYGEEKICLDCKLYMCNKMKERRSKDIQKERNIHNRSYRKIREERLAKNVCVKCGRKKEEDYKMCGICRSKLREKSRKNREYESILEKRKLNGLCRCGEPLKNGYKVCEKCYNHLVEISRSEKAKQARKKLLKDKILY